MVFITEGMSLRIPAGGLRLPLDGSELLPVTVEVRLETLQHWLRVALEHVDLAGQAHAHLLQPDVLKDIERPAGYSCGSQPGNCQDLWIACYAA